jgi:hypothetical protein
MDQAEQGWHKGEFKPRLQGDQGMDLQPEANLVNEMPLIQKHRKKQKQKQVCIERG